MQNNLGVAARLKNRPGAHKAFLELARVDEVAVVTDGDLAVGAVDQNRLRIRQLALAGCRVAHVSNSQTARQMAEGLAVEDVGDVPHAARDAHLRSIRRCNSPALLA